jgi:hypothetical protein
MSETKKEEVIRLLTKTIEAESLKSSGGNSKVVEDLTKKLDSILNGTHISKFKKK